MEKFSRLLLLLTSALLLVTICEATREVPSRGDGLTTMLRGHQGCPNVGYGKGYLDYGPFDWDGYGYGGGYPYDWYGNGYPSYGKGKGKGGRGDRGYGYGDGYGYGRGDKYPKYPDYAKYGNEGKKTKTWLKDTSEKAENGDVKAKPDEESP